MKSFTPLILIAVSIALFFMATDPIYKQVQDLQAQKSEYDDVLTKSQELLAKRSDLQKKYTAFSPSDVERLRKLIPDAVDNVRLIIDMDEIAKRYGLTLKGVNLDDSKGKNGASDPVTTITAGEPKYGTIGMGFSVSANYDTFLSFLRDLEQSLRLVDVTSVGLHAGSSATSTYSFDVSLKTYWLK